MTFHDDVEAAITEFSMQENVKKGEHIVVAHGLEQGCPTYGCGPHAAQEGFECRTRRIHKLS